MVSKPKNKTATNSAKSVAGVAFEEKPNLNYVHGNTETGENQGEISTSSNSPDGELLLVEDDKAPNSTEAKPAKKKESKESKPTQAEILMNLVMKTEAYFFHSNTDDPHAAIPVKANNASGVVEHTEIWWLDSRDFKIWLYGLGYKEVGKVFSEDAVKQVISVLLAKAKFDNPIPITLSSRVAKDADDSGCIWYDLSNPAWQAVKIMPNGWEIVNNPPILFNRYRHQLAQISPLHGKNNANNSDNLRKILHHINIKGQETLFLCWLVSCFIPDIPHPMPIIYGEKGAAKSTACSLLKSLIDPSALETLMLQSDTRTLAVNLQQHWFLPFDNVSYISEDTSDTLCRAITGGGIQQRKLFTNAEDYIFTFNRCLAINGINNVATRPDLLDRSILIELERIPDTNRRELAEIMASFRADKPAILAGIFDVLSKAMAIYPAVTIEELPRMADFTRWGYAIGEALGGLGQQFLVEYEANRKSQNSEAINADPVATLVIALMSNCIIWEGKVSELQAELSEMAYNHGINPKVKGFPSQPNHLSRRLRGMKSNLEAVGITYDNNGHSRNGTTITLQRKMLSSRPSHNHESDDIIDIDSTPNVNRIVTIKSNSMFSSSRLSSRKDTLHNADCDGCDDSDERIEQSGERDGAKYFEELTLDDTVDCPW